MAKLVGGWERQALYYAQMAWAAALPTTAYSKIRENSPTLPHASPPLIPPPGGMGSGLPFPDAADYTQGRQGIAFDSAHPVTVESWTDLVTLLMQSYHFVTALDYLMSTHDAITAGNLIWTPDGQAKHAGVVVRTDPGAAVDTTGYFGAASAVLTGLDIDIPIATPGETAGSCSMTAHWIARNTERDRAQVTTLTGTPDTAAILNTKDCVFKIVATAESFLNASLSITNGASLNASAAEYAPGFTLGPFNITGSITGLRDNTVDEFSELLWDAADAKTSLLLVFELGFAAATSIISFPALILPTPTPGELNGMITDTFNFTLAHNVATNNPFIQLEDATASPFYEALPA